MLEAICGKIGERCHVSRATAKEDFVPIIKALLERKKAGAIASWLELCPEEVEFLTKMKSL
jgi:hypothetical protein